MSRKKMTYEFTTDWVQPHSFEEKKLSCNRVVRIPKLIKRGSCAEGRSGAYIKWSLSGVTLTKLINEGIVITY